jgi:carboxypeptidase family protein
MRVLIVVAVVLAMVGGLYAQNVNVASLTGAIKDQSGAVLPGVEVKVTQTETGLTRDAVSDETGSYALPTLPVGPYRLEAALPGFRTYVQTGIILQVGSNPTVNVVLQVGQVSEQVEVTADAAMVETRSTGVGQVITNQNVLELPLNGRNVTELLMLSGAATNTYQGGNFTSNRQYPVVAIAIAGGSPGGTYFAMDGGSHNDPGNNLNLPVPFPDALQEFKTETGAVPARYGQHANAVVNLVTKSGTNAFHGSGFEFVRNYKFNARNPYANTKESLKRNQFGGTLGGPIFKNKLFFFGGYQGTITRSDPSDRQAFVPTAAMLAGDFTAYASPACNSGRQINLTAPAGASYSFSGNRINPASFDPVALKYMQYVPISSDPCGRFTWGLPTPSTDKQFLARVDYQRSDKHSIFGRYFRAAYNSPYSYDPKNALSTTVPGIYNMGQTTVIGDTYSISPTLINSFRFTFLRPKNRRDAIPFFSPADFGAKLYATPFSGKFTSLSVSPGFGIGGGSQNNAFYNYKVYGFANDIDWIRGPHQFSFGENYLFQIEEAQNSQYSNGAITINGTRTGASMSDFLLGEVANIIQGGDGVFHDRKHYLGVYFQDIWKATSKLTLSYGARWEPQFPLYNVDNHVTRFDEAAFAAGKKSSVYVNAPAGFTFPGDSGYPGQAMSPGTNKVVVPRLGLVYDPSGQGREVIRAAYGIFVDSTPLFDHTFVASNPPWGSLITLTSVSLSDPYRNYPGGNPFPFTLSKDVKFPDAGSYAIEKDKSAQQYTQQWNLSFQRQLSTDWSLTLSYLGNKTTHTWSTVNINPAIYIPGASTTANVQARRRLNFVNPTEGRLISTITQLEDGGNANYNGALVTMQKRFSKNYSLLSNYTWSHCINEDDARQIQSQGGVYTNYLSRRADRGDCSSDVRQLFNLSGVVSAPKFGSRMTQAVAGGWQLSTIYRVQTGPALTITSGRDNALNGNTNQRADQIGNSVVSNPTPDKWFNTAAFVANGPGTTGNSGRNSVRGPGTWNIDMAVTRKFAVKEGQNLELRAEGFNILNHTRLGNPITSIISSDFGRVRSAFDPRILQFALKYTF